jgi:hypothetical protein
MIITKSKKGVTHLIMAFVYDLLFAAMLFVILFGFIRTVDSGMYFWREYYSQDIALTLTLMEGVPEELSVNYVVIHDNILGSYPVELFLKVLNGKVIVSDAANEEYETITNFISNKNSDLELFSNLDSLMISKDQGKTSIYSLNSLECNPYVIDKKDYTDTRLYINDENNYNLLNNIKTDIENSLSKEYSIRLNPLEHSSLIQNLINKNIKSTSLLESDIIVVLRFVESDKKRLNVKYSKQGDAFLSNNVACYTFNLLEARYEKNDNLDEKFNVYFREAELSEIPKSISANAAVVILEFSAESVNDFTFETKYFASRVSAALNQVTSHSDDVLNQKITDFYSTP